MGAESEAESGVGRTAVYMIPTHHSAVRFCHSDQTIENVRTVVRPR